MATNREEYLKSVSDRLIKQIEENNAAWQRPFEAGDYSFTDIPVNSKGIPYKGMNLLNLMSVAQEQGYSDNRWLTFNGAKELGGKVIKGEKASDIYYFKFSETVKVNKKDKDGNDILDEKGKPIKTSVEIRLDKPRVFFAKVFNAQQIEGLPPREQNVKKLEEWERHEAAERILASSNAKIIHQVGERAYYSPSDDHIVLPERSQFPTHDAYYATALHELGHWTGHSSRLNRNLEGGFGSENYAKEELRAEIASMLIGQELQIGHDPSQHVAYLQSWVKVVKNDPKEIFKAVKDADTIHEYILSLDPERAKEQTKEFETENKPIDDEKAKIDHPDFDKLTIESNSTLNEMLDAHYAGKATDSEKPYPYATTPYEVYAAAQKYLDSKYDIYVSKDSNGDYQIALYQDGINSDITMKIDSSNGRTGVYIDYKQVGYNNDDAALITKHLDLTISAIEQAKELNKPQEQDITKTKIFIDVPFSEKNEVKALGGKWDKENKSWFIPAGVDQSKFSKWIDQPQQSQTLSNDDKSNRTYLYTIPSEKDEIKALGAKWDKENSVWYAPADADQSKFSKWIDRPDVPSPEQAFADHLKNQRIVVEAGHPKMDGKAHRLANEDSDAKNVLYQLYPNHGGVPSGRVTNFSRDGVAEKWVYPMEYIQQEQNIEAVDRAKFGDSYISPKPEKPVIASEISTKQHEQDDLALQKTYDKSAERAAMLLAIAPIANEHEYLNRKGVSANNLVRIVPDASKLPPELKDDIVIINDWRKGKEIREQNPDKMVVQKDSLIVPKYSKSGELRSFETIGFNGAKYALKDGEKNGLSLQIGNIENGKPFILAEGYATGATFKEQAKLPSVVTFGKGNLDEVAIELRNQYPDSKIYFAADNDHQNERQGKGNAGIDNANKAAELVGGYVLVPKFNENDKGKDWNDIFIDKGIAEFKNQLKEQLTQLHNKKEVMGKGVENDLKSIPINQDQVNDLVKAMKEKYKDDPVKLNDVINQINEKIPEMVQNNNSLSNTSTSKQEAKELSR